MSTEIKLPPPPNKTETIRKDGLFGHAWAGWFNLIYEKVRVIVNDISQNVTDIENINTDLSDYKNTVDGQLQTISENIENLQSKDSELEGDLAEHEELQNETLKFYMYPKVIDFDLTIPEDKSVVTYNTEIDESASVVLEGEWAVL